MNTKKRSCGVVNMISMMSPSCSYNMRFIFFSSVIVSSVIADIDGNMACQSVCGRLSGIDANDECKRVVVDGAVCRHLYENPVSHDVVHEVGIAGAGLVPLTVARATQVVRAPEDNCFAMCYDNTECRKAGGSYCEGNGICGRLFWNQFGSNTTVDYNFLIPGVANQTMVNEASAVLCDPANPDIKKIETKHDPKFVDMCKTLCELTHTAEECKLVKRNDDVCHRLFWTNESKDATVFSVRKERGTQIKITAQEAFDRLAAEGSCMDLCKADKDCKKEISFCSDNHTCHNLFYLPGSVNRKDFQVCFGTHCPAGPKVAITCRRDGDAMELFNKAITTVNPSNGPQSTVTGQADGQPATTSRNSGIVSSAVAIVVAIAVLVL